jgi:hypothetical protein
MLQQLASAFSDYLSIEQVSLDKNDSHKLANDYLDNYANHSYPLSGLREFINSHLNISGFDELCENGVLAKSGTIKSANQEVTYKVIDSVKGTTLLSTGDQHYIVDNQVWHPFSVDENNNSNDEAEQRLLDGVTGRNYKNIGLLRRLLKK